jgi:hypothetical protein
LPVNYLEGQELVGIILGNFSVKKGYTTEETRVCVFVRPFSFFNYLYFTLSFTETV